MELECSPHALTRSKVRLSESRLRRQKNTPMFAHLGQTWEDSSALAIKGDVGYAAARTANLPSLLMAVIGKVHGAFIAGVTTKLERLDIKKRGVARLVALKMEP